jgi:hypothetical protein
VIWSNEQLAALEQNAAPPDGPEHPNWPVRDFRPEVRGLIKDLREARSRAFQMEQALAALAVVLGWGEHWDAEEFALRVAAMGRP